MTLHRIECLPEFRRNFLLLLCWVTMAAAAPASYAQPGLHVGGWSLTANGNIAQNFEYSGSCPVALRFDWGVVSPNPTEVIYTFARNDGATTASQRITMPGNGRSTPIYDGWQLGANVPEFSNYRGWEELVIESPIRLVHRINFTLHCGNNLSSNGNSQTNPVVVPPRRGNACSPRCTLPVPLVSSRPMNKTPSHRSPSYHSDDGLRSNLCYVSADPPQGCQYPQNWDVGASCSCPDGNNGTIPGTIWDPQPQ